MPSSRRTSCSSGRRTRTSLQGGTGIKPSACRLYVDNKNRSRAADIGKYGLHLQLKNVPNGDHTYKIELRDYAGNLKSIERKFVVAVPDADPYVHPADATDVLPDGVSHRVPDAHDDPRAVHHSHADADAV